MTTQAYDDWSLYHCNLLIIHQPEFDAYLKVLYPMFVRRNVTAEELEEASEWMIFEQSVQDASWRDHARILMRRIYARRAEAAKLSAAAERAAEDAKWKAERQATNLSAIVGGIGKMPG